MSESKLPPTLDQQSYLVVLCQGQRADGSPFWAYLQLSPLKAKAFKQAQATGQFDLADFGDILEWGIGAEVPDDIKRNMEKQHRVNHDFERVVSEGLKKTRHGKPHRDIE